MEIKESKNSVFQANLFYLIMGPIMLIIGGYAQSKNILIGLLISSYLLVFLPPLLFVKFKGYGIKETFKLNRISVRQGVLSFLAVLFAYPVGLFINYIALSIISRFVELKVSPLPIPDTSKELWISLFVIALTPGICEEFMFRGFIMSSYEKLGKKKAIIFSAILFGVFHFNLQNLVGPIFLGLIFGVMVYKTNSIYPAMIGHTINNGISMIITYLVNKNIGMIENMDVPETSINFETTPYLIMGLIIFGIITFALGAVALSIIKSLPESEEVEEDVVEVNIEEHVPFYSYIPIFIVIIGFVFLNYLLYTQ